MVYEIFDYYIIGIVVYVTCKEICLHKNLDVINESRQFNVLKSSVVEDNLGDNHE